MTNTIWSNPVSGDWSDAADWSDGGPTSSLDAVLNVAGAYTVTIDSADQAHLLTVDAAGAKLVETSSGSLALSVGGGLVIDAGTVVLNGVNNFANETLLNGGTLKLGNSTAISELQIRGGSLIATQDVSLGMFGARGTFSLAAATGHTLTIGGQTGFVMSSGDAITFGSSGNDGVVLWAPAPFTVSGSGFQVDVNGGILRDGGRLSRILSQDDATTVAAGAEIDVNGQPETIVKLSGSGTVTSLVSGGTLKLSGQSTFAGSIQGDIVLTVAGAETFEGVSTYNGGTTITHGMSLTLKGGGSIAGSIVNDGTLTVENSQSLSGISGDGYVTVSNHGSLTSSGDTYLGVTTLQNGTLIAGASALGTSELVLGGKSTFESTVTQGISNQLDIGGSAKILADHATTLTLNAGSHPFTVESGASLTFGSSTADGTIVWDTPASSTSQAASITVAGGTLQAGDSNFQTLFDDESSVTIKSGATLDVAGAAVTLNGIHGVGGTIENSGATTTVTLDGGNFSGAIAGDVTLDVGGKLMLGGDAENWSTINVLPGAHLTLNGPASGNLVLSSSDDTTTLSDASDFTGSVTGFQSGDQIVFQGIGHAGASVNYSGDTTGGTLTVSNASEGLSYNITLVGDYTTSTFSLSGGSASVTVSLDPPAASVHADAFNFSAAAAPHVAADAGVAHLHGGHGASEFAFAHYVTEALHAHDLGIDHFTHDLFAHGHGFAEALL